MPPSPLFQVDDCIWLDDLKQKYNEIGQVGNAGRVTSRCVVCSLPVGTCHHDTKWMKKMAPWGKDTTKEDTADKEVSDVLDVLGTGNVVQSVVSAVDEVNYFTSLYLLYTSNKLPILWPMNISGLFIGPIR